MSQQIIAQLEAAAAIVSDSSNVDERHSAEEVFLDFRKSKSPYVLCKEILETSQVHYVLFQASELLKVSVIREWSFLPETEIISLRQYLMHYVFLRNNLPFFVQERLLQVIAIMVKRGSIEDHGRDLEGILTEIEGIIINGDHFKKMLGCKLILILMQEFASTVKSTDVGLTWEVHFKAKKRFEALNLKRIFQFCVQLFSEIIKDPPFPNDALQLIEIVLTITVVILTWGYVSPLLRKRLIGMYESVFEADQAPALRLNNHWHDVMLSPHLLPLMFELYWKIRNEENIAHLAMTCLVQLATLNGLVVDAEAKRLQYFNSYLENFIRLLEILRLNFNNKEALGISNIIRKLQTFFGHDLLKLPVPVLESYINNITRITCCFAEGAQIEESQKLEGHFYMDALDNALEAWTGLFQEPVKESHAYLVLQAATRLFNVYLQTHLAPPDGCRALNDNAEEIEDTEDNDRSKFKDQLQVIGVCGRIAISNSLPLLFRLLEDRSNKLKTQLQIMKTRTMTLSDSAALDNLFEDIHWIVLISGNVLCMDSDGETPLIPNEIMRHSIKQHKDGETNLETSLKFVAAIKEVEFLNNNLNECDHAIRIFSDVLKLCMLESSAASVKLGHFMSPELGSTLMWFLRRWCISFLLPNEHYYQEISPTLIGTLGKDTDAAAFITNFILEKIQTNICHFSSEPILIEDTVNLFIDLVYIKNKSVYIIKTEGLWNIVKLQLELKPGSLQQQIRRGLFKGLVLAGAALNDQRESDEYYHQILNPLHDRFKNVFVQSRTKRIYQDDSVQIEIVDILECLIGLAMGTQMSTAHALFQKILPILTELPIFLSIYHNYQVVVQLILELFGECARYMLCYLNHLDSNQLYDASLLAVRIYVESNRNRFSSEVFAEESSYQDLLIVLQFLTLILSKDCLDLNLDNLETQASVSASDVSLYGLKFLLPLIKLELLMYPSLCAQYYKLIASINDLFPDKIAKLPKDMLQQLLFSLELGLTKGFGDDVVQSCLDFIQSLASYLYNNKQSESFNVLLPFLKLVFDLTLMREISSDVIPSASVCIYSLICCYKNEYQMIVDKLVQSQSDHRVAERLVDSFQQLTNSVLLNCELQPKLKFRDNFDKFISEVNGFLLVK